MKITKELDGDFLVLTVSCPPLPDKKISILAEALYKKETTIQEQIVLATTDAEYRLNVYNTVLGMIE